MRVSQIDESVSSKDLPLTQLFGILRASDHCAAATDPSNYMRANKIGSVPILPAMPGPWGKAIEALRVGRRLTREVVAKRAKMTPTTFGRIERGQHTQTRKLQDIADVFGVSIEKVLILPLQNPDASGNTAVFPATQGAHGQNRPVQALNSAETIYELYTQVQALQAQLAKIAAERAPSHRRSGSVSTTRVGKPLRARNARKSR